MMAMFRTIASLTAASALALAAGCNTVVVVPSSQGGAPTYASGKLIGAETVNIDQGWNATQAAVRDLQFTETDSAKDAFSGHLYANRADGTQIRINLKRKSDTITQFDVKVGVFGDRSDSELIYDKIKAHLGSSSSADATK